MRDYFANVLDEDEKVVASLKPVKSKFFIAATAAYCVISLLITLFATLVIMFPFTKNEPPPLLYRFVPVAVFFAGLIINCILDVVWYKNVCYCYTDRRIIIRCGVFGVYYRFLDLASIGAADVSITLLDRMLRMNTGTIRFGTLSGPIVSNASIYAFMHIRNPYDTFKKIKDAIDEKRNNSTNVNV